MTIRTAAPSAGELVRPRVLDILRNDSFRVVSMVAPAGYGKTAVLRSWTHDGRPFHYVQPSAVRDDGADLLFLVRRALDTGEPYVLAVDGIGAPSPNLLMSLFLHVHSAPEGSLLLLASRRPIDWANAVDIPPSVVRQIGPAELVFTPGEAAEVLAASAVELDDVDMARLYGRTRGWPIAQYLSALLLRDVAEPARVVDEIVADEGELAPDLVSRLLSSSPAGARRFLTRTSVLMTMSGPLCDWLLEESGSEARLADLADRNMLVAPVHGDAQAYRYQRLFGELLRAELNDRRPDAAAYLHLRAGDWFAARGDDVAARWHRQAAHTSARNRGGSSVPNERITPGAPDMSLAELQVLAFLPSHMSFQAIGVRLGRSGSAIQRLAIGIYRKLGVISRRDAVERALVLGLVRSDQLSVPSATT